MTSEQLQSLVSAAVGADTERGDQVQVVASAFESTEMEPLAFYEEKWFADILRYATALIAVLLVLFLAVRPLIKRMREISSTVSDSPPPQIASEAEAPDDQLADKKDENLPQKVELARQLASSQPDRAVEALQRMLEVPQGKPAQ